MATEQPKISEEELKRRYEVDFDPDIYLTTYYTKPTRNDHSGDYMKLVLSSLHRIFAIELPEGDSVLELGCGPTMFSVISASDRYNTIVLADLVEKNRKKVQQWIRNEAQIFDWTYVFKMAASLEKEPDHTKLEARLRSRIKEVIPCDVTLSNPLAPLRKSFDVIVTTGCYEVAATDDDAYKKIVANTANLLAPNGHLIVAGALNLTHYVVGQTGNFHCLQVRKELVEEAMSEAGLEIINWQMQPRHEADPYGNYYSELFVLLAKKMAANDA